MSGKRGKRYPRDFKFNAARLVVEGGYSYRKAAERLGIRSRRARRYAVTTDSNHDMSVAKNLIARDFSASGPNKKWLANITCLATEEGWLYLAVILDCYSRYIVGWAMSDQIDADLVCQALETVLIRRRISSSCSLIRGSQYASDKMSQMLLTARSR